MVQQIQELAASPVPEQAALHPTGLAAGLPERLQEPHRRAQEVLLGLLLPEPGHRLEQALVPRQVRLLLGSTP